MLLGTIKAKLISRINIHISNTNELLAEAQDILSKNLISDGETYIAGENDGKEVTDERISY